MVLLNFDELFLVESLVLLQHYKYLCEQLGFLNAGILVDFDHDCLYSRISAIENELMNRLNGDLEGIQ